MEFRKVQALRGPNIWARFPVLEVWVDLQEFKDSPSNELPGFNDRLMAWLPTMIEHRCGLGYRGGFFERLRDGTWMGHILEHVTLELQELAGTPVGYGKARESSEAGVYKVVIEYEEEALGRASLATAFELLMAAVHDKPFDINAEVKRLRALAAEVCHSPGVKAILEAAEARGIPVRRLDDKSLFMLGQGARQRRLSLTETDRTSSVARAITHQVRLARSLLRSVGVPVCDDLDAPATTHRLLVVNGQVAAAARLVPPGDVTETLHPEVIARALDAARIIGLDIAGIDVAARDLARPLEEQEGVVTDVKASPDLEAHLPPSAPAKPVGEAIIEALFAKGDDGRIPIVAITGVNGKTTVTRLIAHIIQGTGKFVGMTCTDGIYLGARKLVSGDCSGPRSARDILLNPLVEVAVLETARGGILREGLGFDRSDVAVVTNIGEGDHLGLNDIHTLEKLAYVKATIPESIKDGIGVAVLNAADPLVVGMKDQVKIRGKILYFALDGGNPVILAHRAEGGCAAFVRDGSVILAEGPNETPLIALERVPLTHAGRIGFQVENVLASASAVAALGLSHDAIRAGLESFVNDMDRTPGRFNVLEAGGATVILDFGHNPSAIAALVEAVERFPNPTRVAVFSADGDRPDESILRQGALIGSAFDRVVLYDEPARRRGRAAGEIPALLRQGLAGASRTKEIVEAQGEIAAIEAALQTLRPGELVLIQVDAVEEGLALARKHLGVAKP